MWDFEIFGDGKHAWEKYSKKTLPIFCDFLKVGKKGKKVKKLKEKERERKGRNECLHGVYNIMRWSAIPVN